MSLKNGNSDLARAEDLGTEATSSGEPVLARSLEYDGDVTPGDDLTLARMQLWRRLTELGDFVAEFTEVLALVKRAGGELRRIRLSVEAGEFLQKCPWNRDIISGRVPYWSVGEKPLWVEVKAPIDTSSGRLYQTKDITVWLAVGYGPDGEVVDRIVPMEFA